MPQFDTSIIISQLFWLFLVFGALYLIISYFVVPNIESVFFSRKEYLKQVFKGIESHQNTISDLKSQRIESLEDINILVQDIDREINTSIDLYHKTQNDIVTEELNSMRGWSQQELQRYKHDFEGAKEQITINLAKLIVEKLIQTPVNVDILKRIYNENLQ